MEFPYEIFDRFLESGNFSMPPVRRWLIDSEGAKRGSFYRLLYRGITNQLPIKESRERTNQSLDWGMSHGETGHGTQNLGYLRLPGELRTP